MILCLKCNETKTKDHFYKSSLRKDGLTGQCKDCNKARVKAHREANLEKIKAYDRSRNQLPHRVEARKKYQETEAYAESSSKAKEKFKTSVKGKESKALSTKKYREKNVKIYKAHNKVNTSLCNGSIVKPKSCENCNITTTKLEAHHCDYNKPLDLMWLCIKCHVDWHKNNSPIR